MEYFVIIFGAIFVNNIVLAQFLGICPFLVLAPVPVLRLEWVRRLSSL